MEELVKNPCVEKSELLFSLDELELALDRLTNQLEDKIQKKAT